MTMFVPNENKTVYVAIPMTDDDGKRKNTPNNKNHDTDKLAEEEAVHSAGSPSNTNRHSSTTAATTHATKSILKGAMVLLLGFALTSMISCWSRSLHRIREMHHLNHENFMKRHPCLRHNGGGGVGGSDGSSGDQDHAGGDGHHHHHYYGMHGHGHGHGHGHHHPMHDGNYEPQQEEESKAQVVTREGSGEQGANSEKGMDGWYAGNESHDGWHAHPQQYDRHKEVIHKEHHGMKNNHDDLGRGSGGMHHNRHEDIMEMHNGIKVVHDRVHTMDTMGKMGATTEEMGMVEMMEKNTMMMMDSSSFSSSSSNDNDNDNADNMDGMIYVQDDEIYDDDNENESSGNVAEGEEGADPYLEEGKEEVEIEHVEEIFDEEEEDDDDDESDENDGADINNIQSFSEEEGMAVERIEEEMEDGMIPGLP